MPKPLTSGAKSDGRFGKQDFAFYQRRTSTAVHSSCDEQVRTDLIPTTLAMERTQWRAGV